MSHKLELRLTCIKLAGFKSFVDSTTIPVSSNLVGIVGPNGCGKSNVIDAVRWVLGESKASALRGDSIQDVIFAGSNNRKAIGRASVEIIFDNELKKNAGQWANYAEISIKRVLQRDGISSYYINNIQVRRRDISDLFLGTGVGGQGYAIIEQGMLSKIIEAKPIELKGFLEEAAGTSQYRERRQETATRLTETRKNLTRLADIQQELLVQLQHLESQAESAERYQIYQHELARTQAMFWLQKRNDASKQQQTAASEIHRLESELEHVVLTQRKAETETEQYRELQHLGNDKLQLAQQAVYTVNAQIGRTEQEIKHFRDSKNRLQQQIREIEIRLEKNVQLKVSASNDFEFWRDEKEKAQALVNENVRRQDDEHDVIPDLEKSVSKNQEQLNQCRQNLITLEQSNRVESAQLEHQQKNIQQLEIRHTRLLSEQNQLPRVDSDRLIELQSIIEQIELRLEEDSLKHEEMTQRLTLVNQERQRNHREMSELNQSLSQVTARFKAISSLQQKLHNAHQSDKWFRQNELEHLPKLWQKIAISVEWEGALESVMRERLNSIQVDELDAFQGCIEDAPINKWIFFEQCSGDASNAESIHENTIQHCNNHFIELLTHIKIKDPEIQMVLQQWLNHVYVIESIEQGFQRRRHLNPGEILVTPQGHIFTQSSFSFYAPDSELHGVLSRQQELEQVQQEMARLDLLILQQNDMLRSIENDFKQANGLVEQSIQERKQSEKNKHNVELEFTKYSQLSEQFIRRNQQISSELIEIQQALEQEHQSQQVTKSKLTENLQQIESLKKQTEHFQKIWQESNQLLTQQREKFREITQQAQQVALHANTCDNKINEVNNKLAALEESSKGLAETQHRLNDEIGTFNEENLQKQYSLLDRERLTVEQALSEAREGAENIMSHLREAENTRLACEHKTHKFKDEINQARLKEQAATINIEQFNGLIRDAKQNIEELIAIPSKRSIAALQAEINRLNADIAALGAVNLSSLEELANAQSRQSNLALQMTDLNEAIATLENVIQKIDSETELRLKETFNQVNQYLSEIFPIVFSGGQAKLELNDGKILDAGLVLTAQPPGKKNSSIHLLSGGEKALTALALIFALFKLNPAPFCLLDEVDAPLDDRNTERFCELVKNMSEQTQFLFISHNKIAMEMAKQLIGVTMQEQGVSKIVTVDIADAIKIGRQIKQPAT